MQQEADGGSGGERRVPGSGAGLSGEAADEARPAAASAKAKIEAASAPTVELVPSAKAGLEARTSVPSFTIVPPP